MTNIQLILFACWLAAAGAGGVALYYFWQRKIENRSPK
jgi:hypothetical protein